MSQFVGDNFASGEGLEDAMYVTKKKLFMLDEMDTLFNSMKQKDARSETIMQRLLSFYSSVNTFYAMRAKAKKDNESFTGFIINPYLVLYGTALPKYFYGALEERVLENGLIPRTLIVDAGDRGKYGNPQDMFLTPDMAEMLKVLKNKAEDGGNLSSENPNIRTMPETDTATAEQDRCRAFCDEQSEFFHKKNENAAYVLWNRANEKINKLAMLYATSRNVYDPIINTDAVKWARDLVVYLTRKMLFMADTYSYVDGFDKDCKKALKCIHEFGGLCKHSVLSKKLRRSNDQFKRIIDTLVSREEIVMEIDKDNGGRPGRYYRYIGSGASAAELEK